MGNGAQPTWKYNLKITDSPLTLRFFFLNLPPPPCAVLLVDFDARKAPWLVCFVDKPGFVTPAFGLINDRFVSSMCLTFRVLDWNKDLFQVIGWNNSTFGHADHSRMFPISFGTILGPFIPVTTFGERLRKIYPGLVGVRFIHFWAPQKPI